MNNKKLIPTLLFVATLPHLSAHAAEYGINAGAGFNTKVDFISKGYTYQPRATDIGEAGTEGDRYYDNGAVLMEDIDGNLDYTRLYRYDDSSAVDNIDGGGGTLSLYSNEYLLERSRASDEADHSSPSVEIYWKETTHSGTNWSAGVRLAFRWEQIDFSHNYTQNQTIQTTTDTYDYPFGALLNPAYDGTTNPQSGYPALDKTPSRTVSETTGEGVLLRRDLLANIIAFDFGPHYTYRFTDRIQWTSSIGLTAGWIFSEFEFSDGDGPKYEDRDNDFVCGYYANSDLQYQLTTRWGVSLGAAINRLETYEHKLHGRTASMDFNDSFNFRLGVYFQ